MQLTIDIKDSALDKIMYFLNHLKSDVKIISQIDTKDSDFKFITDARKERKENPQNYGTLEDIDWN